MARGKWRLVGVPPAAAAEQETAEQDWLPYPASSWRMSAPSCWRVWGNQAAYPQPATLTKTMPHDTGRRAPSSASAATATPAPPVSDERIGGGTCAAPMAPGCCDSQIVVAPVVQIVVAPVVRAEVCPTSIAGIYSEEQVAGWKPVVKAVKDKGAAFFCQVGGRTPTHLLTSAFFGRLVVVAAAAAAASKQPAAASKQSAACKAQQAWVALAALCAGLTALVQLPRRPAPACLMC